MAETQHSRMQENTSKLRVLRAAMTEANKKVADIRKGIQTFEGELLEYLQTTDIKSVSADDGSGVSVEIYEGRNTERLSEEYLDSVCKKILGETKGTEVVTAIYENRVVTETQKLKMINPKKPAAKRKRAE